MREDETMFYQTVPNSHFWGDLASLKNWLEAQRDAGTDSLFRIESRVELLNYLLTGINNTIGQKYDLVKLQPVVAVKPMVPDAVMHTCLYSKYKDQSYPRKCMYCGRPEIPPPPTGPSDRYSVR